MASGKMWQTIIFFAGFICLVNAKSQQKPLVLTEDNWKEMLTGEWMVKLYAPWCPACKALVPTWEKVAGWSDDLDVKIASVDVTENPGLSGRFMVMSLPTIYHVKDGVFRQYRGSREESKIISFIDDKEWESLESVAWYRAPDTTQMAAVGLFFQLAMQIRNVHTWMTEEYGLPVWGSYAIFSVLTIIVGLLLGLILVFICDTMFPPAPPPEPTQYRALRREPPNHIEDDTKDNESDIVDDRQDPVGAEEEEAEEASVRRRVLHAD